MADTFVKVALIVIIIVLVGFLGVLTGYIVKPVTESTTTTTTLVTTQPTTTAHITTTTPEIEVVTTVPKVLCSPCFSYFAYRGHDDTYLLLRNGARTISIKGVTFSSGENIQILHKCSEFPCDVTITYIDVGTGVTHIDSATLSSPYPPKTISFMGASCNSTNQITLIIRNEGNVRIEKDDIKIYVDDVYKGTFGHIIEPLDSWISAVNGHFGTNNVKVVSPTNTAGAPVYCSGTIVKTISVMAYSCNPDTDVITLTISNKGNTRIEEDEIEIYVNDEYIGTFGRIIEPDQSTINSFPGNPGQNTVKVVSPSNSVRIVVYCY